MYHSQTSAKVPGRPQGFEPAIGQIDLLDAHGETLRSWRIQSSKCTVGSSADCTIQLDPAQAAPLHASLIFGKRHTLLRAIAPTKIANRNVREWLIDHPTEISLGSTRIVVHPCIGVMATVVQAEQLLDRAARLCSESTPVVPVDTSRSATPFPVALPPVDHPAVASVSAGAKPPMAVSNQDLLSSFSSSETKERLERIEQMLLSLQSSLDRVQATIHVEPKESDELISDSVADHFDSFGKTLFSTLNDQFSSQTERHESLLSSLSEQVAQQFATIDQQLQYVTESTSHQSMQLGELLEFAIAEQSLIEARFSEVAANRDELMQALHVLHNEIANAHDTYANSFQSLEHSVASVHEHVQAPVHNPIVSQVQDQILAESLEKAQTQIQQYNHQLRELETERKNAEQRIVTLADSLASQPNRPAPSNTDNQLGPVSALASNDPLPQFSIDDRYSVDRPYQIDARFAADDNNQVEVQYGAEALHRDETPAEKPQLPSWFTNSEPVSAAEDVSEQIPSSFRSSESAREVSAFSMPDLSQYSDHLPPDQQGHPTDHGYNDDAQGVETPVGETNNGHGSFAQDMYPAEPAYIPETDTGSISQRLQRMIVDADARRGSSSGQMLTNSRRWSQTYGPNSVPSMERPELSQVEASISEEQETSAYLATDEAFSEPEENHLSQTIADITETSEATNTHEAPAASTEESEEESEDGSQEESIEEYMQRLLHRVRTGSDSAPAPSSSSSAPASVSTPVGSGKSRVAASLGLDVEKANPQPETLAPLTQESFVPRQQAPEQRNDLAALRELANSNARRAISRSDSQRTSAAFFFKLAVTGVAVTSAVALLMLNGLQLNMPFAGMIAAIIVAFLWGFDCLNHFKRRQSEAKRAPASNSQSPAMNSIQVGSRDTAQDHWRPTPV